MAGRHRAVRWTCAAAFAAASWGACAADVTFERLANSDAEPQNWLTNHGAYNGQHHSTLATIDRSNVARLKLAYAVALGGTSTNELLGDLEDLAHAGHSPTEAAETIAARPGRYPARVVALVGHLAGLDRPVEVQELPLHALRPGMTFTEDVHLASGILLVAHGYVVTPAFLARLRNFPEGAVRSPVRVAVHVSACSHSRADGRPIEVDA